MWSSQASPRLKIPKHTLPFTATLTCAALRNVSVLGGSAICLTHPVWESSCKTHPYPGYTPQLNTIMKVTRTCAALKSVSFLG